jgi:hypothetical protein
MYCDLKDAYEAFTNMEENNNIDDHLKYTVPSKIISNTKYSCPLKKKVTFEDDYSSDYISDAPTDISDILPNIVSPTQILDKTLQQPLQLLSTHSEYVKQTIILILIGIVTMLILDMLCRRL